jgi:predicted ATP-grasp superfamily ATP-dependent carboligase
MKILFGLPIFSDWKIHFDKMINDNSEDYHMCRLINIKNVNELIKKYKIDVVIPLNYKDMNMLAKSNISCLCMCPADPKLVIILDNKLLFYNYFVTLGLSKFVPKIYDKDKIIYPAIVKPKIGCAGNFTHILKDEKDVLPTYFNDKQYMICEYIYDKYEYIANVVALHGDIKYCLILRELHGDKYYIKHGAMIKYDVMDNDLCCFNDIKRIFKEINYTGMACVDFKIANDELKIFEINPRFGGTVVRNNLVGPMIDSLASALE